VVVGKGLSAAYGDRVLFQGLDLVVGSGDVVGLVGPNGSGKSTLLRILAGDLAPETGSVELAPSSAQIGYLRQEPERIAGETLLASLHRRTGVAAATARMDLAAERLTEDTTAVAEEYSGALEAWLSLGGADLDERIAAVIADLGLEVDLDQEMSALSGGQAARVGLAGLLLSRFDFYLLDEPTNDLDVDGLELLEDFIDSLRVGVVVVSHDREFLSRTVTNVVELDRSLQRAVSYGGGYDAYLQERSVARRAARDAYEEYAGRRGDLEARARRQRAWMAKGVRNARRKIPDSDKITRKFRGDASEKQAAKARQTDRMIERLTVVSEPRKEWSLQFTIAAAARSGEVVATLQDAIVSLGSFTLGPVSLQLARLDRVAITGPNGGGKSTILGALLGRLPLSSGERHLGSAVVVGEVDQVRGLLSGELTLGRAFGDLLPDWVDADVRTLLAKFGLSATQINRTSATLSPGERTRAALALLQARGVNLLVLDEPTNHLDLSAIEQLEQALDAFEGTLLLVTHDRRMLDTVLLTRRWDVVGGSLTEISAD
jgi:ATPase subunit of ABC transporter with duplicated ATPase domains